MKTYSCTTSKLIKIHKYVKKNSYYYQSVIVIKTVRSYTDHIKLRLLSTVLALYISHKNL